MRPHKRNHVYVREIHVYDQSPSCDRVSNLRNTQVEHVDDFVHATMIECSPKMTRMDIHRDLIKRVKESHSLSVSSNLGNLGNFGPLKSPEFNHGYTSAVYSR